MESIIALAAAVIAAFSALAGARIGRAGGIAAAQVATVADRDRKVHDDQRHICANFLGAIDAEFILLWRQEQRCIVEGDPQHLQELADAITPRLQSLTLIRLECPAAVEAAAAAVARRLYPLHRFQPDAAQRTRERSDYDATRKEFITTARIHLDGLRPQLTHSRATTGARYWS